MNRVVIVVGSLRMGGAERQAVALAEGLSRAGMQVSMLTFESAGVDFYSLNDAVQRHTLNVPPPSKGRFQSYLYYLRLVAALRKQRLTERFDAAIAFGEIAGCLVLCSTNDRRKVVVSERTVPGVHPVSRLWQILRAWSYPRAARVVCQTAYAAESLRQICPTAKTAVISNVPREVAIQYAKSSRSNMLLTVGRLESSKRVDWVIQAFSQLHSLFPDWSLTVVGDGPQRAELEAMSVQLGLAGKVRFLGQVHSPDQYYGEAQLLVHASEYEGVSNVVMESILMRCPVVGFERALAPSKLVQTGVNGELLHEEGVAELTEVLHSLMSDAGRLETYRKACDDVAKSLSAAHVISVWQTLLETTMIGSRQ